MISRGVLFPEFSALAKETFVDVAARDFRLDGKRVTDSRLSLLTGLQRRDIRMLRAQSEMHDRDTEGGGGHLPRILARWQGSRNYCDSSGKPLALPRSGENDVKSFESLIGEISRDMHPRTMLDELMRLDLVSFDTVSDTVTLTENAFLPRRNEAALLQYFGDNLGDHAKAAAENLLVAPEAGPFFERAVHYNRLSSESIATLDQLARDLQMDALSKLNAQALALQDADTDNADAIGRFRCGAFIFFSRLADTSQEEDSNQ